jgi:hypothetical protein
MWRTYRLYQICNPTDYPQNPWGISDRPVQLIGNYNANSPLPRSYQKLIWIFSDEWFEVINRQSQYKALSPQMKRYVEALDDALAALPAAPGTVWREINIRGPINEFLAPYFRSANTGEVIVWDAYSSTSYGGVVYQQGNVQFVIESKTGRNIEGFSFFPEREVLLPRGAKMIATEPPEFRGGKWYITLREVTE